MNLKNITLFEHQKISYSSIGLSSDDELLKSIERLNLASKIEYLEVHRNYIKATSYVGIFVFEDWWIQVLPKIDFDGNANSDVGSTGREKATRSAAENLIYMLSYIYNLQISSSGMVGLTFEKNNWFEMLIFMFSIGLRDLVKTGIYKEYISVDEQLSFIKGKWLLGRQLIEKPHLKHKFLVTFDEYSEDNTLNRILKFCAYQMIVYTQNRETKNILSDVLAWLSNTELIHDISMLHIEKVVFTRINRHYEPLYNLAIMFIKNRLFTMFSGRIDSFAIMFDMNQLFEEFVYSFVNRFKKKIFPDSWDTFNIKYQSEGQRLYLATRVLDGKKIFGLQPDILFSAKNGETIFVVDTKYKIVSPSLNNYGVAQADAYQMLAYATRFKSKKNILIYPQGISSSPLDKSIKFEEHDIFLKIGTINLHQEIKNPSRLITEFSRLFGTLHL